MRLSWSLLVLSLGLAQSVVVGSCAQALPREDLVRPLDLLTSCGRLLPRADYSFEVPDACFRAVDATSAHKGRSPRAARLSFSYLGATDQAVALASGELRRQVGLKLRAQDTCNVIYVMWHIAPDSRIEVSVKQNPGQSEHAQCADRGYHFVKAQHEQALAPIVTGSSHVLEARIEGHTLSVEADSKLVWQGRLPTEAFALDGPVGLRSDNAHLIMQLAADMTERAAGAVWR